MDIYSECPTYKGSCITLRLLVKNDTDDLFKCYSDPQAVELFNSDNCNGDNFYYATKERMKQAVDFWEFSYKNRYFVRFTVIDNSTQIAVGTVEMFHGNDIPSLTTYGVLRIDLRSDFEIPPILSDIVKISVENFYSAFGVENILTKVAPQAEIRKDALKTNGFTPYSETFKGYDNYYIRSNTNK